MVAEIGNVDSIDPPEEELKSNGEVSHKQKIQAKKAAMALSRRRTQSDVEDQELSKKPAHSETVRQSIQTDDATNMKKKGRRKYKPAPWLCENITVESRAPIRSDLDDALAFMAGRPKVKSWDEHHAVNDWIIEADVEYWNRTKRKGNFSGKVGHVTLENFDTKCKVRDEVRVMDRQTAIKNEIDVLECGSRWFRKREVIRSDVLARLKEVDEDWSALKESWKANTEKKLARLGLKRRGEIKSTNTATQSQAEKPKSKKYCRVKKSRAVAQRRKARWSHERKEERVRIPHEYELHALNVECDDPEETDLLVYLMDLQNRDLSPEDYEMLLRLDDKIAPKTMDADKFASLRTETVSGVGQEGGDGDRWEESPCTICMEAFENEQSVKFLPCTHFFHAQCIEMWLTNSGNRCPLDGMEV